MDPLEPLPLGRSDKSTYVSSLMSGEEREQLWRVLLSNADVFAWTQADMIGINPAHASHRLNVIPSARPVQQRIRRFHPNRHQVIQA